MNDQSSGGLGEVLRYIKEGPDAGDNSLLKRMAGFLVWWRMWAMYAIILGSLLVLGSFEPSSFGPRMWGYIVGIFTMSAIEKVTSDKYGI